jgi:hypothetical protein
MRVFDLLTFKLPPKNENAVEELIGENGLAWSAFYMQAEEWADASLDTDRDKKAFMVILPDILRAGFYSVKYEETEDEIALETKMWSFLQWRYVSMADATSLDHAIFTEFIDYFSRVN